MNSDSNSSKTPGRASINCLISWLSLRGDYETAIEKGKRLKGWRRYTSTVTQEGRAYVGLMSIVVGVVIMGTLYTQRQRRLNKQTQ